MGLKARLDMAVNAAFKTLGDIPVECSLTRNIGAVYDEVTDSYSGGTPITYTCAGIVKQYDDGFRGNDAIQVGDFMIVIRQAEIATEPQPGETLDVGGISHKIVSVYGDAANVTYTLQVRK